MNTKDAGCIGLVFAAVGFAALVAVIYGFTQLIASM